MYPASISKHNSNSEKKIILSIISNGEKKLSESLRKISSKHVGDFYCLNCLLLFRIKTKRESHQKVCGNKDFCGVLMLSEDTNILEFNKYRKYDETPSIIYADLE